MAIQSSHLSTFDQIIIDPEAYHLVHRVSDRGLSALLTLLKKIAGLANSIICR